MPNRASKSKVSAAQVDGAIAGLEATITRINLWVVDAVNAAAAAVQEDAAQRAPTRKVYGKPRRAFRLLGKQRRGMTDAERFKEHKKGMEARKGQLARVAAREAAGGRVTFSGGPGGDRPTIGVGATRVAPRQYSNAARRGIRQYEAAMAERVGIKSASVAGDTERFKHPWRLTIGTRELFGRKGTPGVEWGGTMSSPTKKMALNLELQRGVGGSLGVRGRFELRQARLKGFGQMGESEAQIKKQRTAAVQIGDKVFLGGRLKASIRSDKAIKEGRASRAYVATDVYYAKYVEFGTRRSASQPFLRPALKQEQLRYNRRMALMVNRAIKAGRARGAAAQPTAGPAPELPGIE